jgi:ADP-ribose pyrophosphatase YjhB (NUDIX family)
VDGVFSWFFSGLCYHNPRFVNACGRFQLTSSNSLIKFCNSCGAGVTYRVPEGDSLPRALCDACGTIQYENPKIVVGCLPVYGERILICKRAIEPRYGLWTLPAGFMENHETADQGAAREALEEANARVAIEDLYTVYSLPHISQVYMMFRAQLLDPDVSPGIESLEVKLVTSDEIPWDQLAFTMVRRTLEHYLEDRKSGVFVKRYGDIFPPQR